MASLSTNLTQFINSFKKYDHDVSLKVFTDVIADLDVHTDVLTSMISIIKESDELRNNVITIKSVSEVLADRTKELFGEYSSDSKQAAFCKRFATWKHNPEILANLANNYLSGLTRQKLNLLIGSPLKYPKKISCAGAGLKADIGIPTTYAVTKIKNCILAIHAIIVALYEHSLSDFDSIDSLIDILLIKKLCRDYISSMSVSSFQELKKIAVDFFHETSVYSLRKVVDFIKEEETVKCVQSGKHVKRLFDQERSCRIILFAVIRAETLEELNSIVEPIFKVSAEFYMEVMEEAQKIMYNYGD